MEICKESGVNFFSEKSTRPKAYMENNKSSVELSIQKQFAFGADVRIVIPKYAICSVSEDGENYKQIESLLIMFR